MKKLLSKLNSKGYTHLLLLLSIFWSLLIMYGGTALHDLARWGMTITLVSLAGSILSCTVTRWKPLLRKQQLRNKGLLGSVVFHFGLLVMLLGFLVNLLWNYQGILFLPEGERIQVPGEYVLKQQGIFAPHLPKFEVVLEKLDNALEADQAGNTVSRPKAILLFEQDGVEARREVEVNYPAHFKGLSWRQLSWGYSLLLTITPPSGEVVRDYVNLATHTGKVADGGGGEAAINGGLKFYDIVPVAPALKLDINYHPEAKGRPQMIIKLLANEQALGQSTIPLGTSGKIGSYSIKFEQVRHWQAMDLGFDPGRYLLYVGGFLAVSGLVGTIGKYRT